MTDPKPKAMTAEEAIHTLGLYLAGDELKHKARAALSLLRGMAKENARLKKGTIAECNYRAKWGMCDQLEDVYKLKAENAALKAEVEYRKGEE